MKTRIAALMVVLGVIAAARAPANEIMDNWWREVGGGLGGLGVPEEQIRRVFANIDTIDVYAEGPGSWVYEFKSAGDVYLRQAKQAELTGTAEEVLAAYKRANGFYDTARFPALFTPARKEAYRLQTETYLKLTRLQKVPLEVVRIPFEGKEIVADFYNDRKTPAPVIIWSGGIDGWRMAGLDFKQTLMKEGFAVLAMDLPGTGDSQFPLAADSDRIYSRVVDYLKTRPDVDGGRIATYFGSFSGVYAIKLALIDPDVKASVNHSGGIHIFFTRPYPDVPPLVTSMGMRRAATVHAMGMDGVSLDELREAFASFSLERQGLLKPTPTQSPLLSIYGTEDVLMPIEDLEYLHDAGVKSDDLVYEGDHHMAWEHASDHRPKMIAWLKKQLGMK